MQPALAILPHDVQQPVVPRHVHLLLEKEKVILPPERREVRQTRRRALDRPTVLVRKTRQRVRQVRGQLAMARHERNAGKELRGHVVQVEEGRVGRGVGDEAGQAAGGVLAQVARRARGEGERGEGLQRVGAGGVQAGDGGLHPVPSLVRA